jgi:hypothetical protein
MKCLIMSLAVSLSVAALIWALIFMFEPTMNVEKAFSVIFYPAIIAGVVTALVSKRTN